MKESGGGKKKKKWYMKERHKKRQMRDFWKPQRLPKSGTGLKSFLRQIQFKIIAID